MSLIAVSTDARALTPRFKRGGDGVVHANELVVLPEDFDEAGLVLGDHTAAGYRQPARFYAISEEGRLGFAKNIAAYLLFLAENTGLAPAARVAEARARLDATPSLAAFHAAIAG